MEMEKPQRYVIFKDDGQIAPESKQTLREHFDLLPENGTFQVTVEEYKPKKFTATRYKYYFDCILGLAFAKVRLRFELMDMRTGEVRNPKDVEELHYCLKLKYNPVYIVDRVTGVMLTIGATTTDLSDSEFINDFGEEIVADFSGAPYYAYNDTGCPTRKEWAEMHRDGSWGNYKGNF